MNIMLISRELYPYDIGGKELFLNFLIQELSRRGNKVWVFSQKAYKWNNNNVRSTQIKVLSIPYLKTLSYFLGVILSLRKLNPRIDLINIHHHDMNVLGLLLIKTIYNIPYLITVHGGGLKKWRFKSIFRLAYRNAACVITVSDGIKHEYGNRGCKDVLTIPPMLPFERHFMKKEGTLSKYGLDPGSKVLLFLGRLTPGKRPDFLLKVFISLGEKYIKRNKVKLIFAGDGPLGASLQKMVEGSGLNQSVKFLGYVPHHQVGELFRLADVFILPSDYEGFPLSVIEAMHYGLTVIGSDTRGINEIITHNKNGLLFPKGDAHRLKQYIIDLLEDEEKRAIIGNSAKKHVRKHYSFSKTVDQYIDIYKKAISSRNTI
ncbi:MAG: glycosyltransferase family 4 protein [Candidatus Hodarchaeota archaeon]